MKRSRMSYGDAKAADEKETYKRDMENKQFPFRRDVQLGLLWTGAGEGGESAAGTSAFHRMIYVHDSATKCRNKISAQSEMNFVDC